MGQDRRARHTGGTFARAPLIPTCISVRMRRHGNKVQAEKKRGWEEAIKGRLIVLTDLCLNIKMTRMSIERCYKSPQNINSRYCNYSHVVYLCVCGLCSVVNLLNTGSTSSCFQEKESRWAFPIRTTTNLNKYHTVENFPLKLDIFRYLVHKLHDGHFECVGRTPY